jgi:serine/threonine-protein kinase RsbW
VSALTASPPPTPNVEVARWVLDSFAQLRILRAALHEALTGEPLPGGGYLDEVPEKMAVVATELATNALVHARPPTIVELRRTQDTFILDIADEDPGEAPHFAELRSPGAGGLGLQLTRRFALDIGWYIDGPAKHVWAEFTIPTE